MLKKTTFQQLKKEDCKEDLLDSFNRYQKVTQSWRKKDDEWVLIDNPYIEQWDAKKKQDVIAYFKLCIENGDFLIGCFFDGKLIGWVCVNIALFGSGRQYVNLELLHVSFEYRNNGLGKELFRLARGAAKELGAIKLYISSHSSKETQAFYKSLGCRKAEEIDTALYKKEPFDCHLELIL